MKKCKKGQGALEYLMTYGWALLIIVVVGAALYALGVLNPSTYTKSTCAGFSYFSFVDQQLKADGSYSVVLYDGNQDVTVVSVKVGLDTNTSAMTGDNTPAATQKFTLTSAAGQYSELNPDKAEGDAYNYDVIITYNTLDLTGKTDIATCTGTVQV